MGQLQEYKVKKTFGRDNTRSRIPRLILKPVSLQESQISMFPLSEDKTKDCDISRTENRTISPNSFSSDDTGCPSSQCPSPTKIRSGSENSSLASPIQVKSKAKVRRVRVSVAAESNGNIQKRKREKQHPPNLQRGSEADFSSASSTGSFKSRGTMAKNSTGTKSCLSYSHVPLIRSQPICKSPGSPTAPCDNPCRTPPKKLHSSCSSNNSGPTIRRLKSVSYHSCGDNHGIRPPNPEQYLTPLQQKEVAIRHLKTQLKDCEQTVSDRESEIHSLKSQLDRMREDWIEEECHRVEAQLSLKEARKEIKQLRQVVETMKNSLMEKDKGIQKYFIDINIQNRKLESLLHSMELAQSDTNLHDEPTLDFICNSSEKLIEDRQMGELEEQAEEVMTDSRLFVNDELTNQMNTLEQILMSTAMDYSQDGSAKILSQPGLSTLSQSTAEDSVKSSEEQVHSQITLDEQHACDEKAVQTDEIFYNPHLQALLLHILKLQNTDLSSNVLQKSLKAHESNIPRAEDPIKNKLSQAQNPKLVVEMDDVFYNPALSPLLMPQDPGGSTQGSESPVDPRVMEDLDVDMKDTCSRATADVGKNHRRNSFLVDLFAVAAPVLPMVTWLYSQHNAGDGAPEYNVGTLFRGCCTMGLHSLRLVTYGPHV